MKQIIKYLSYIFGFESADHGAARDTREDGRVEQAAAPDNAVYVAAVAELGERHASGKLDKDLASAAAQRLGRNYRERYAGPTKAADPHTARAQQLANASARLRGRLLGKEAAGRDGLVSQADDAVRDLLRAVAGLKEQVRTDEKAARPGSPEGTAFPTEWEESVIEAAGRLQVAARNIANLAREHSRIAADCRTESQ